MIKSLIALATATALLLSSAVPSFANGVGMAGEVGAAVGIIMVAVGASDRLLASASGLAYSGQQ
jgi:hypothetical protein